MNSTFWSLFALFVFNVSYLFFLHPIFKCSKKDKRCNYFMNQTFSLLQRYDKSRRIFNQNEWNYAKQKVSIVHWTRMELHNLIMTLRFELFRLFLISLYKSSVLDLSLLRNIWSQFQLLKLVNRFHIVRILFFLFTQKFC